MSNRENLASVVVKKIDDGIMQVHYQVLDERAPVAKRGKRISSEYCLTYKEKEGSDGKVSVLSCYLRVCLHLGRLASALDGFAAKQGVVSVPGPQVRG